MVVWAFLGMVSLDELLVVCFAGSVSLVLDSIAAQCLTLRCGRQRCHGKCCSSTPMAEHCHFCAVQLNFQKR